MSLSGNPAIPQDVLDDLMGNKAFKNLLILLLSDSVCKTSLVDYYGKDYYDDYSPNILAFCPDPEIKSSVLEYLLKNSISVWHVVYWNDPSYFEHKEYATYREKYIKEGNRYVIAELLIMAHNNKLVEEEQYLSNALLMIAPTLHDTIIALLQNKEYLDYELSKEYVYM